MDRIRITIVSACRNEARHIRAFLDSLLKQDFEGMDWEAIIADGMSDDGTAEVVSEYGRVHPQLKVIANPGRIVSTGLNAAIRLSKGEIILRMDAHTEYAPDYCRRCVETLEQTGAANVGGPARTKPQDNWGEAIAAAYHSPFSTGGARFHQESFEGWVDTVPYGCWRRETLEAIGMFDETLVRNQDDELNLRLTRAGGRIWQSSKIVSWYSPRGSLKSLFRQYFQYGYWKVAVIRMHKVPGSWRHLVPALAIAGAGLLVIGAALGSVLCLAMILGGAGLYAMGALAASVITASGRGWRLLPRLPLVFATYHLSYGSGFLAGLVAWVKAPGARTAAPAFTRLSR